MRTAVTKEQVATAIKDRGWEDTDRRMKESSAGSCRTCWGHGIWAIGDPVPMGPMDAQGGMPTTACPECGRG